MRNIIKVITIGFLLFLSYTFVFGFIVFNLPLISPSELSYDYREMLVESSEPTYAYVLEDKKIAIDARLALIKEAEETINISYYTIHGGTARNLFFGALLEKADAGIEVNIIIDHMFYYQTRDAAIYYEVMMAHENIDVKLYEPYNPFLPYTIQNRLHDKLIMIDDSYGIIGGRNIGDRYYEVETDYERKTFDRDVLIFGEGSHSTVSAMNDYYELLFNHDFSVLQSAQMTDEHREMKSFLVDKFLAYQVHNDLNETLDVLHNDAIPVKNATFMHSPLDRMHKHPVIVETLSQMAESYDEWFIQSPYIIFSSLMKDYLPDSSDKEITFLSNNPAASTNLFAMSGYNRHKPHLSEVGTLYEFQHEHSLHGKSFIFGREVSVIGSLNLDPRSTTLSTESVMVLYGEAFTEAFYDDVINWYLERSLEIDTEGNVIDNPNVEHYEITTAKRIAIRIAGIFTYFFDSML